MRARASALVALIALTLAVAPTLSSGGTRQVHQVDSTVTTRFLEERKGVEIDTGTIRDAVAGRGAAIIRTRTTESASLDLAYRSFFGAGSQRGEGSLRVVGVNPDGTVNFRGNAKIVGGTGRFRGATGWIKISGVLNPNDERSTASVTGKVVY